MKKEATAPASAPAPKPKRGKAKVIGGFLAVLVVGSCMAKMGGDEEEAAAPATTASSAATVPSAASSAETSHATEVKADTAASLIDRMDCTDKILSKDKLDADALTPNWVTTAKSVAACSKNDFTQIVVAEYATNDEALQAVARAQKSDGWHNRVTVDRRFARGASGNDWSSVDFPKANQ